MVEWVSTIKYYYNYNNYYNNNDNDDDDDDNTTTTNNSDDDDDDDNDNNNNNIIIITMDNFCIALFFIRNELTALHTCNIHTASGIDQYTCLSPLLCFRPLRN